MPTTSRTLPAAMALMMLLPVLGLVVGPAGGEITPELTFISFRDLALDENDNGLYDVLVVEFVAEVTVDGSYTIKYDLTVEASGDTILIKGGFIDEWLEVGNNTIEIRFASEDIFRRGYSGVYNAELDVQKFDHPFPWTFTYTTRFYDHRSFEAVENPPPVPPDAPEVDVGFDAINISTDEFMVFISRDSPEVTYRYRDVRPGTTDFHVAFEKLLIFSDDGDDVYDGEDVVGSSVLLSYPWAFTFVEVSGPRVSFDLRTHVSIAKEGEDTGASLTLTFIVTNGSGADPDTSPFIQGGAAELKMDINLMMDGPVPGADRIAIQARVSSEDGSHGYMMEAPSGFHLYQPLNGTGYLPVPRLPTSRHTKVGLVDGNGVEHGFIAWMNSADESWAVDERSLPVDVDASFRVHEGDLELYWSYPYSEGLTELEHDPSVGVLTENLPPQPQGPEPEDEPVPNLYLYLFAVIVGAVILMLSVYARAQGY
jgi:hypothetical protein